MGHLKQLRSQLGFTADEVTTFAGWPRSRLNEIEGQDDLDEAEASRLSDLYGVDLEQFLASPGSVPMRQPVAALLKAQADVLDAGSRFSIAEATSVARTVRRLQTLLGSVPKWSAVSRFASNSNYAHPRNGLPERLAQSVRRRLNLGTRPIRSIPDEVFKPLGIIVLWEDLPSHIDAISMATPELGAVIVANLNGEHTRTGFGRRVVWAHEVCHLLFDRAKMRALSNFCAIAHAARRGETRAVASQIERRARAFAAWFLAPREPLADAWEQADAAPADRRVRAIMDRFGMGYEATRGQLDNAQLLSLEDTLASVPTETPPDWEEANPPANLNTEALGTGVSPLRAGVLLEVLIQAHGSGLVSDAYAREQLRIGIEGWERLRPLFKGARGGRWHTSVAAVGEHA